MVDRTPQPAFATVAGIQDLSPALRRIVLAIDELAQFRDAPNVKLLFGVDGLLKLPYRDTTGRMIWPVPRPVVRTYSARTYDAEAKKLVVDFLLHGHGSVASNWARRARIGDRIGLAATGGRTVQPARRYLFVADHCALPAVSRAMEELHPSCTGGVFIQVSNPGEVIDLVHPSGLTLHWLCQGEELASYVQKHWRPGSADFIWIGAESSDMRQLRQWLRDDHLVPAARMIAVGYWRRGLTEDGYQQAFDHDRDADYHAAQADEYHRKGILNG